jgi:hypothetical protein
MKSFSFTTTKDLKSTFFGTHHHDIINVSTLAIPIIEGSKLKKLKKESMCINTSRTYKFLVGKLITVGQLTT